MAIKERKLLQGRVVENLPHVYAFGAEGRTHTTYTKSRSLLCMPEANDGGFIEPTGWTRREEYPWGGNVCSKNPD